MVWVWRAPAWPIDAKGIKVDARLRTTNARIFAIGDVAGGPQFTHAAAYQAGIVIRNILFRLPARASTRAMPRATYTDPELAAVGLSEAQAQAQGLRHEIVRWPFADNDRARAGLVTDGLVKVVVGRGGRVLGAAIVGAHAGELILPWVLAVERGLKLECAGQRDRALSDAERGQQAGGRGLLHATPVQCPRRWLVRLLRASRMRAAWRRWLPLAVAGGGWAVAVYASGLHRELSLAGLQHRREALQALVAAHPLLAPLAFVAVYASAIALSLPGALFLTLAGGFLFGTWLGGVAFGGRGHARRGGRLSDRPHRLWARPCASAQARGCSGWRRDFGAMPSRYLLVLRLVPLFPFWLVNLVPALLGVSLRIFALATFLGIIPGCLVYAGVGSGLGTVLDRGEQPDLRLILEPQVLLPLLGLAALALVPVLYRRWQNA